MLMKQTVCVAGWPANVKFEFKMAELNMKTFTGENKVGGFAGI